MSRPCLFAAVLLCLVLFSASWPLSAQLPREIDGLNGLCRDSIAAADMEEALRICRRVSFDIARLAPGSQAHVDSLIRIGDVKWAAGNYVDADAWYREALTLIGNDSVEARAAALPLIQRIIETKLRRGSYLDAELLMQQALALIPDSVPADDPGRTRLRLRHADLQSHSQQHSEADATYRDVIAIFAAGGPDAIGDHRQAVRRYAESLEREQKFARAEAEYRTLITLTPAGPAPPPLIGPDGDAEAVLGEIELLDRLAYTVLQQGRREEALGHYQRELLLMKAADAAPVDVASLQARLAALTSRPRPPPQQQQTGR